MSIFTRIFGSEPEKGYKTAEIYDSLRGQIFDLQTEGKIPEINSTIAVLMETGMDDACYTLVAVGDGSASIYLSNGGGIIGGGQHPQVADTAKALISKVNEFEKIFKKTDERILPKPGHTRFYIIRKNEILTAEFKEEELGEGRENLSPLFHDGHKLITTIRLIEEQRQKQE